MLSQGSVIRRCCVALFAAALLVGCTFDPKVPIVDVGAGFVLADATWFEAEQTLFVFYRVDSVQGLSDASQIELAFMTDEEEVPFTPLEDFAWVHPHLPASCGVHTVCGSASVRVELPPRQVQLRLRYHRDGALTLDAPLAVHVVNDGPAHLNRSALLYGVFGEDNRRVQWRLRHQFPAIRNEDAQALGLRRRFSVAGMRHGSLPAPPLQIADDNPYGYALAAACPVDFDDLGFDPVQTEERAVFQGEALPLEASVSAQACAVSEVEDALGSFRATTWAQKNPQVAPAFPFLATPVEEVALLKFMLRTCSEDLDAEHFDMQLQRLQQSTNDVVCIDDFATDGFVARLAQRLQGRIDDERAAGVDMVLVLGLNRPDDGVAVASALEAALALVVEEEQDKSTPRMAGVFVFDSAGHAISTRGLGRHVLWCPSTFGGDDLDAIDNASLRSCAVQSDGELVIGPIRAASLPILPTRAQYRRFVDRYSVDLAGRVESLSLRAPVRTPLSENVAVGGFGVATFFNNEAVTAQATDAFSYCVDADPGNVVFRIASLPDEPLPLAVLPDLHASVPQTRYALGLVWDFPFLLQLKYESFVAGAATVQGFTIPFGRGSPAEAALGTELWSAERFDLTEVLLRCERFCAHPTFDSAGVYNVRSPFDQAFRNQCYVPRFPQPGDGGFPRDP